MLQELIEDVCLLTAPCDDVAIVAQSNEEDALSLLHLGNEVVRLNSCEFFKRSCSLQLVTPIKRVSLNPDRRLRGVSALHPIASNPRSFITGGYDHAVHLWTLAPSLDPSHVEVDMIDVKHTSTVQSLLAIEDTSTKLLSAGADCAVNIWDLPSERILIKFELATLSTTCIALRDRSVSSSR